MSAAQPLHNYLLTYRRRFGYSQKELAGLLGCSESQVYRYERGQIPDLETAFKLELIYRVPLQDLFRGFYDQLKVRIRSANPAALEVSPSTPIHHATSHRILALDPWTRGIGVAVLEDGRLLHAGVRYLRTGPLPDRLLTTGRQAVERLIGTYKPTVLVLPQLAPSGLRRSPHVRRFLWQIRKMAARHKLKVVEHSRAHVLETVAVAGRVNKHRLAVAVADRFPELHPKIPPRRKPWQPQDLRMSAFYAVALALTLTQTSKGRLIAA